MTATLRRLVLLTLLATSVAAAAETPGDWNGWTTTRGGEGGTILRVTTLAATGPGSLASALAADGARTIVFDVGGVIDLGGKSLRIRNPHLTLAGETAPSPGVTLTNGGVGITTHDVIIRHVRIRVGARDRPRGSGWEVDGLATGGGARDVWVDQCSISWATDENLSASGPRFDGATPDDWRRNTSHRITFSRNIIGEALHDSTHSKGPHSKGSLVHDNTSEIFIVGNLYISNDERNPLFKGGARGAVANNVIHNPGRRIVHFGLVPSEWTGQPWQRGLLSLVGNVARRGPGTAPVIYFFEGRGPVDVHLRDNLMYDLAGQPLPIATRLLPISDGSTGTRPEQVPREVAAPPVWPPTYTARPANETLPWVLANAGARPWDRDDVDQRLVREAMTGAGKIIHFESEVGGLSRN